MSETNQLSAHYAVLQLDALREQVVMSYRPTIDLLIAEFDEKHDGVPMQSRVRQRARRRRIAAFVRYRETLLAFVDALLALRHDCGTDPSDLPHGDDDVPPEHNRIRAVHEAYRREKAGLPPSDDGDVDDMVDRQHEALLDHANGDGPGPWFAAAREGGDE